MFCRDKKEYQMPMLADLQAIARVPTQVWGFAKLALVVWAALWVVGFVTRVFTSVHAIKIRKSEADNGTEVKTLQPVYALFSFNFNSAKPAQDKAQ